MPSVTNQTQNIAMESSASSGQVETTTQQQLEIMEAINTIIPDLLTPNIIESFETTTKSVLNTLDITSLIQTAQLFSGSSWYFIKYY